MEGIRNYNQALADEVFNPLSAIASRTAYTIEAVVMLLYIMSGLNVLDILIGIPGGVVQIGINLILIYNLKILKSWARIATLVRAAVGMIANFFILGLHNASSSQLPGLTIVFLIYAIFPLIISAILMESGVKQAFQN
jgi:hypothetical protein